MKALFLNRVAVLLAATALTACSTSKPQLPTVEDQPQLTLRSSGTIIISGTLPPRNQAVSSTKPVETLQFAPLLGYAPSTISYTPASNEYWLEIRRDSRQLSIRKGEETVAEFEADGLFELDAGDYVLERKESQPSWYAPDSYFTNRSQSVPSAGSPLRFRRGALGSQAIFGTQGLVIHSSPLWTPEVGGVRIESREMNQLFESLAMGTRILVY